MGQRLAEYIGVAANELPTLTLVQPMEEDVKKFKFQGEITQENL